MGENSLSLSHDLTLTPARRRRGGAGVTSGVLAGLMLVFCWSVLYALTMVGAWFVTSELAGILWGNKYLFFPELFVVFVVYSPVHFAGIPWVLFRTLKKDNPAVKMALLVWLLICSGTYLLGVVPPALMAFLSN